MPVSSTPIRLAALVLLAAPGLAQAQIRTSDPSSPDVAASAARGSDGWSQPVDPGAPDPAGQPAPPPVAAPAPAPQQPAPAGVADGGCGQPGKASFRDEEIFGAAERVFGDGTQGIAKFVQDVLKKQGCPTAYIAGREAGGAIGIGLRYGQGDLYHKVEGQQPIYWTGPSLGLDIGGAGSKVLILVYNLYDSEELFERFPLVEGNLYAVGGFTASYLRRGDVALVPIRLGVGWRFGASVGYMNFSHKGKVLPF
ncbi:DUF1134 domain-containing protein [Sphingomonas quercus]|uniref:DUF1134 domain-containing protein n=1 Tax=Sphingomonas quercus TaxID=2842451 RepID=A0ABS6BHL7_9SPHN|nr:EipA family protein [Sphingomonas quercus]MBU3077307.1 DUF1134 domain-containing protein [Sphingomonas quercus]